MADKSASLANSFLQLLFNGTTWANIAVNATSSPATTIYAALHNTTLTSASTQATGETAYTSYTRIGIVRTSSGFVITGNSVSPAGTITFPVCTGGTDTITYVSFGLNGTAGTAGTLLYWMPLASSIAVATGVQPVISASSALTEV
jgi:hypothetical protein